MAKYRPLYIKTWSDPDFAEYPMEGKLLFIYLITNPLTTESGIYQLPLKTTSTYTKIPVERLEKLLSGELKNIYYDVQNSHVFVRKFKRYNLGGNPDLIRKSISADYNQSRQSYLWSIFLQEYPEYSDIIINPKPLTVNPKQLTDNGKQYLEYSTIPITSNAVVGKVLNGTVLNLPDNKIVSETPRDLEYWNTELNKADGNGHKIGVLVEAFKYICAKAPSKDFNKLGDRIAGIVKHNKDNHGIVLRNMYMCPVYKPDDSWLDYIDGMSKSKYVNTQSQAPTTKLKRVN